MADGKQRSLFPAWRMVALAVVAGLAAGAIAVYVSGPPSGNTDANNVASAETSADKACAAKVETAKTIAAGAVGQVAAMAPAEPPRSMTQLAFNGPDGKPMTLGDHAGKTVLLNLWATWCVPCREEMPALDALQKNMGGSDFEVVAINVDNQDGPKPGHFLDEIKVATLTRYKENTLALFNNVKRQGLALGLPVTLLIDKEGCLLAKMNGPADWASEDARKLIEAAKKG